MAVVFADLERAIAARDPALGELFVRYLAQDDPEPGRDEAQPQDDGDESTPSIDVPAGAMTIAKLTQAVSERGMSNKNPTERKLTRREAFAAAEASPFAPPRLRVGALLLDLYARGDAEGHAALLEVFRAGRMQWGVWKAAKAIYKQAEETKDVTMFGVLAYRFDSLQPARVEIGPGTVKYLRRRAWRFLRQLGTAAAEAYVAFAVEVLRHYPASHGAYASSWVAAQIWGHGNLKGARGPATFQPPTWGDAMGARAFPAAWKISPVPLLRLLESADNELVCDFAIRSLRADHPLALRAVEPAWLARLGGRPVAAIHTFVVSLLRESPELHQSKLAQLGLHDVVLAFLLSPSQEARTYALEYAAAHAPTIGVERLVELVEKGASEVAKFAAARLEAMTGAQLGLPVLLRLLRHSAAPWVEGKLATSFAPKDIDAATFVETSTRSANHFAALVKFWNDKQAAIPAGHWTALVDDPRSKEWAMRSVKSTALGELGKRSAREIGVAWIQKALENRETTDAVARWLDAGMLSGSDLDVEWLKTLVGKPRLRPVALRLLADRRRVAPARVGLAWLLDLARSTDPELASFAQRMLLESFQPADFAPPSGQGASDNQAGVHRLWELAAGKKSPEAVRTFAATYLKAHHPDLGPRLPEAKALGITPRLGHDAYPLQTLRPLLSDDRQDVRRLAAAIAVEEIVRWGDKELVYELAGAAHREPRAIGSELLLSTIAEDEAQRKRFPAEWLDGRRLFGLAESSHKASREVALTLIRRLYDAVGGAERLGWLMESPERDVRLFAVRLFWDRHRPKPWPEGFVPRKNVGAAIGMQRFLDLPALQQFARVVLFGLPPGRIGESDPVVEGAPKPERALPASIAKKRLIEAMRDVGLEDVELAKAIAPVLREFTSSTAKGEWQASVQALVQLEAHHGAAFSGAAS